MGYDTARFVDISPELEEELTCIICAGILCEPVFTQCGHAFCRVCINRWIKSERTCPVCRKNCSKLSKAPVMVTNLLGRLRIRCDNESRGCAEVIKLEQLESHLSQCRHRVKRNIFKSFLNSLLAPFNKTNGTELDNYETEVVDDYVNHRHFVLDPITGQMVPDRRRLGGHEDVNVLTFTLQGAALVGFVYNIFNMLRS